jgi:hypothetical protein
LANPPTIKIEGYSPEELLSFSDELIEPFIFTGGPATIKIGSAEILGAFRISEHTLIVELAHIDGGGEGVLLTLRVIVEQYAKKRGLKSVEWIVHAINCATPNMKLRRILEIKGFQIRQIPGIGEAFYLLHEIE